MRHRNSDGHDRHPHDGHEHHRSRRHHGHGRRSHHGQHGGRVFDYGELRLLIMAMIAEQPRHGYELIRTIEGRMGGSYSPSPGVVYPTLSWLEDMGYAAVEAEGGRKSYRVTPEGEIFIAGNRGQIERLFARITAPEESHHGEPAPVTRGLENLKVALRLRFRNGPLDPETADTIAAALDAAAQAVERA